MTTADDHREVSSPDELAGLVVAVGRDGDRQAFAALFRQFAPRIKAFLLRSGLPAQVAEDLAQEAMVNVWRRASTYDPAIAGAATWIFTIARNLRIDHLRRQGRMGTVESEPVDMPDLEASAEDIVLGVERDVRVREALGRLNADQARVVRLAFYEDKPHSEIARDLDLPLGTVKSRMRLAFQRLRALMEETP